MEKQFECFLCKKIYSSKSSLWNHNNSKHNIKKEKTQINQCKFCNKTFSCYKSKWRHQKNCTQQQLINPESVKHEIEKIKEENERLKEDKKKSDEIIRLQKKLLHCKRLDTKTFKAANKILMGRSYNHSYNNNTNSNNTINNNIQFVSVGKEDLTKVLTDKQKRQIINARLDSIEKIVEIAHCGDINQFKNIVITNLKDDYAYKYDNQKGYFVSMTKNDLLEELITSRITDIEEIYEEFESTNKISDFTKKAICKFLENIKNNGETTTYGDIGYDNKYDNYRCYKKHSIKILLYNNQDKIAKDIYMRITDNPSSS